MRMKACENLTGLLNRIVKCWSLLKQMRDWRTTQVSNLLLCLEASLLPSCYTNIYWQLSSCLSLTFFGRVLPKCVILALCGNFLTTDSHAQTCKANPRISLHSLWSDQAQLAFALGLHQQAQAKITFLGIGLAFNHAESIMVLGSDSKCSTACFFT